MRLGCYYTQELTLAETGRILGEHEATVSRKLACTRTRIREHVEQALTRAHGLSPAEIELCYQYAVDQGIAMQEFGNSRSRCREESCPNNGGRTRRSSRRWPRACADSRVRVTTAPTQGG